MGLIGGLLRLAATRPRVLVVPMPGATAVRLAVEGELRRRGWPTAAVPAEAGVLLVAGEEVPGFAALLDEAERGMVPPACCVRARRPGEAVEALDAARRHLANLDVQRSAALARADARRGGPQDRGAQPAGGSGATGGQDRPHGEPHQGHCERGAHDPEQGGDQHQPAEDAGHHVHAQHGGTAHGHARPPAQRGGHDGHGMHGMGGMGMPAGLPMAGRGEDRDGLRLDRLRLPLGPILADWPAGLLLRLTVQGDVVQRADVETVTGCGGEGGSWWTVPWSRARSGEPVTVGEAVRRRAAAQLDSLGRFLAVAGWADAATTARWLRDDLIAGTPQEVMRRRVGRFAHRVGRSWTLRWLTRGLGRLDADTAAGAGVTGPAWRAGGDVTDRYRQWLADVIEDVAGLDDGSPLDPTSAEGPRGRLDGRRPPSAALVDVLPGLLAGAELAGARLIVASLDPDVDELIPQPAGSAGG